MAFLAYVKTKGTEMGPFPGQTKQTISDAGIKPSDHSEIVRCEYRAHGALDPKTGKPTGHRQHEPFRMTLELDRNYGRYMKAVTEGQELELEITFTANKEDGQGGEEVAMTLKFIKAYVADVRLVTGHPVMQSSATAKGKSELDTPELYEVSILAERLEGDSGRGNTGKVPWVDDWKKPGSAKG